MTDTQREAVKAALAKWMSEMDCACGSFATLDTGADEIIAAFEAADPWPRMCDACNQELVRCNERLDTPPQEPADD
jgi:hypothetical protein